MRDTEMSVFIGMFRESIWFHRQVQRMLYTWLFECILYKIIRKTRTAGHRIKPSTSSFLQCKAYVHFIYMNPFDLLIDSSLYLWNPCGSDTRFFPEHPRQNNSSHHFKRNKCGCFNVALRPPVVKKTHLKSPGEVMVRHIRLFWAVPAVLCEWYGSWTVCHTCWWETS